MSPAWLLAQSDRMRLLEMARILPRYISVDSTPKLKTRILRDIDEMNAAPVVFRWKNFDLEVV
ncbi:hypothetical protein TK06_05295 [Pseudomonas fluorescens]|uniref:Uncharacterized protein n=1 Tax=Pseudomonas fluorescens TaxID=294 RepID=A0A165YYG8_PSEFL|nr:hypothetical protein TK06_05295 [Pseudomonas fluorescens]